MFGSAPAGEDPFGDEQAGKTDLLIRFFQSQWFDEWIALTYLYKSNSEGVQDYLCNRLYTLPEEGIERYLMQLAHLVLARPHCSLERVLIDLCARSLRIACKVYWLVTAFCQEHPRDKYAEELRDRCEQAALDGYWEPPFKHVRLPMSPVRNRYVSPPLSPTGSSATAFSPQPRRRRNSADEVESSSRWWWHMGGEVRSPVRGASPEVLSRPMSPVDLGRGMFSSYILGSGLEGLVCASPTARHPRHRRAGGGTSLDGEAPLSPAERQGMRRLRSDLLSRDSTPVAGDRARATNSGFLPRASGFLSPRASGFLSPSASGFLSPRASGFLSPRANGFLSPRASGLLSPRLDAGEMFSPPSSPRQRQTTFGATLDFIEALCDASAGLTNFAHEDRQWALIRGLEDISQEVQAASRSGVAIWSPMGSGNQRIVRIAARDAKLLNSRDKAPFLLFIEVLHEPAPEEEAASSTPAISKDTAQTGPSNEQSAAQEAPGDSGTAATPVADIEHDVVVELQLPAPRWGAQSAARHVRSTSDGAALPSATSDWPGVSRRRALFNEEGSGALLSLPQQGGPERGLAPAGGPVALATSHHVRTISMPPLDLSALVSARDNSPSSSALDMGHLSQQSRLHPGGGGAHRSAPLSRAASREGPVAGIQAEGSQPLKQPVSAAFAPVLASSPVPAAASNRAPIPTSQPESPFAIGLQKAMEGLRGDGPCVSITLEVGGPPTPRPRDSRGPPGGGLPLSPHSSGVSTAAPHIPGSGLLCKLGFCKVCNDVDLASQQRLADRPVRLRLTVNGGMDLRLATLPAARHRRVPSHEALIRMAAQHKTPVPPPAPAALLAGFRPGNGPPPVQQPPADRAHIAAAAGVRSFPGELVVEHALPVTNWKGTPPPANSALHAALEANGLLGTHLGSSSGVVSAAEWAQSAEAPAVSEAEADARRAAARAVYGEPFETQAARIRKHSPYGRKPGWAVRPVIVKSGDDCRQELLAMQLIRAFHGIFQEAGLPLWLRPYEVLCTSNQTSLIELVPNTLSLHAIKARSLPDTSLRAHFTARYGEGTPECTAAQRSFVESMAGYSLVCYLLAMKDRHNGNILLDDAGHVVHIDFGFMLSNSPGGVNFESAPFKLTRELLEVMDSDSEGSPSQLFDYFKVLCIQGFLACRKHADRILLLAEMMAGSGFPCFKGGARTVQQLRRRFHLNVPEAQCVEIVLGLISDSLDAWRTRQYDYYQRVLNGIL